MNIQIPLPRPSDSLESNIEKIHILNQELSLLTNVFFTTIDNLNAKYEELNLPKGGFFYSNKSDKSINIHLNVTFKSYLFILRQNIEKIFRVMFQSLDILEYKNVQNSLPDLSKAGNFSKKFPSLLKREYLYDENVINCIDNWRDMMIVSRILRNTLKVQATLQVHTLNIDGENNVSIICPVLLKDKSDKTLPLLRKKMSVDLDDLKNFTLKPNFMNQGIQMCHEIVTLIEENIKKKSA